MSFELHDPGIAHRKAKENLSFSSHASWAAIANDEERLSQNLKGLMNIEAEDWIQNPVSLSVSAANPVAEHNGVGRKSL